jgi:hypothetical protein
VTLAVTRNVTSSRAVCRQKVAVYQYHRMPLAGSRWDIRCVCGGGKTPTFCVFPVFSVAVMKKCCDACGGEEYHLLTGCSAPEGAGI